MRSRPFSLVGICLFLAVFYEITGGGESSRYGESIAALLMMALMVNGHRTWDLWGPQRLGPGRAAHRYLLGHPGVRPGICPVRHGADCGRQWDHRGPGVAGSGTESRGFAVLSLRMLRSGHSVGGLAGLLAPRLRWLAAVLLLFLVVLSLVLFLPLMLYSNGRFDSWGSLPWLMPLLLVPVWLAGEVLLYRELQRLCVR